MRPVFLEQIHSHDWIPRDSGPAERATDARTKVFGRDGRSDSGHGDMCSEQRIEEKKLELHILQGEFDGGERSAGAASVAKAALLVHDDDMVGRNRRQHVAHSGRVGRTRLAARCPAASEDDPPHSGFVEGIFEEPGAYARATTAARAAGDGECRHYSAWPCSAQ